MLIVSMEDEVIICNSLGKTSDSSRSHQEIELEHIYLDIQSRQALIILRCVVVYNNLVFVWYSVRYVYQKQITLEILAYWSHLVVSIFHLRLHPKQNNRQSLQPTALIVHLSFDRAEIGVIFIDDNNRWDFYWSSLETSQQQLPQGSDKSIALLSGMTSLSSNQKVD